jgi:hypothetical protein
MRSYSVLAALIAAFLFASPARATPPPSPTEERQQFPASSIQELVLQNTSGKVVIRASTAAEAWVVARKRKFSTGCLLTLAQSGSKLEVKVEQKVSAQKTDDCEVDLEITLAKNTGLGLTLGRGILDLRGFDGKLTFKLGTGAVVADSPFKSFDGTAGTGQITLKGLVAGGELKTGDGELDLAFTQLPKSGSLELKTGKGNAKVSFPKGSRVKASITAGIGKLVEDLKAPAGAANAQTPAFPVSFKTGFGDLLIKGP